MAAPVLRPAPPRAMTSSLLRMISQCPQPSGNRPAKNQGSRQPKTSPCPGSLGLVLPPSGLKYTVEKGCEVDGPWEDQTRNLSRLSLWTLNSFLLKMVMFFRAIPRLTVARQTQDPALYQGHCPAGTQEGSKQLCVCAPRGASSGHSRMRSFPDLRGGWRWHLIPKNWHLSPQDVLMKCTLSRGNGWARTGD